MIFRVILKFLGFVTAFTMAIGWLIWPVLDWGIGFLPLAVIVFFLVEWPPKERR